MSRIYLDNNGTTPLDPRVIEAMQEEMKMGPSNPSSIHSYGRAARSRLSLARELIAKFLNIRPSEILFTGSGTEALNLAILGLYSKGRVISSSIEHSAVLNTLKRLSAPITYLPTGLEGCIKIDDLQKAIESDVSLIVLSAVNSETGVKNPIEEIAQIAGAHQIPLIVDGVALLGKELFQIPAGVTAMAFSSHKIHGPKGVGALFIRKGTKLTPQITGGGQEMGMRGGTENLLGIIGFAKAVEILKEELPFATKKMKTLRDQFENGLKNVTINGSCERVCNTSSVTFSGIDAEALLIQLDGEGICASMGSACSSGALEPSKVLMNMGLSKKQALSTIRFSLSRFNSSDEIQRVLEIISQMNRAHASS